MHLIVYTSTYTGREPDIDEVLSAITATSKIRNKQSQITGVLFYQNRSFLQVIEGEQKFLQSLMARLETDPRHSDLIRLLDQSINARHFDAWNMDSFNLALSERLQPEKLEQVSEAFRDNPYLRTDMLVQFYKHMM